MHDHFEASFAAYFLHSRADDTFRRLVPKLSINFEEILSRARGNFEEQTKALEPSMIIITYCIIVIIIIIIIIISVYYNCVI